MSRRVLVVDDHDELGWVLGEVLEDLGFVPALAATGQEGLSLLRSFAADVVLLDLGLPDTDGLSVARRVSGTRGVPVIALTGRTDMRLDDAAKAAGLVSVLTKPPDLKELAAVLTSVTRTRRSDPTF